MKQTRERRKYPPIHLGLLLVYVFVLVNKVLDDRKTNPISDLSAICTMLKNENKRKWGGLKTLPLPFDLLLH
jgi:hypothetical protein